MSLLTIILIVLLALIIFGALPVHSRYGYRGDGGLVVILVVVILVLWLAGVR